LNGAQQLLQIVHSIPNQGPTTEWFSRLAAYAQQAGVPQEEISRLGLPPGATVEEATKNSRDLLGDILHSTFPQRITNADIQAWKLTAPSADQLPQSLEFLVRGHILPQAEQAIGRWSAIKNLPNKDRNLDTLADTIGDYDKKHPLATPTFSPTGSPIGLPNPYYKSYPDARQRIDRHGNAPWTVTRGGKTMAIKAPYDPLSEDMFEVPSGGQ
jgi:hypothetical protein